ncbi:MAG: hypothetical protein J5669_05000 [Bacteroidales bacterium]|nr:hypothetical protein [Bacteroidales bacterium]
MYARRLIWIVLAAALWACGKNLAQAPVPTGNVRIVVQTEDVTKSSLSEGDAISDVLLLLVRNGQLATNPVYQYVSAGASYINVDCGQLPVGSYDIYAYANTGHTDWLTGGVQGVEKMLSKASYFQQVADRMMNTLTGTATPGVPSASMLLTGHSSLLVDVTDNFGFVTLKRPVMRFNVLVNNHANVGISLTSLTFSDFNPSKGYILPHEDGSGAMVLPSDITYRSLPAFSGPLAIGPDTGVIAYSYLMYEGRAPSYTMQVTVEMTGMSEPRTFESPVTLQIIDAETSLPTPLTEMKRNQDLTVVLNVYYQELEGVMTVDVDNVYWITGHTSSHEFN